MRKLWLVAMLVLLSSFAFGASTTASAIVFSNDASVGTVAWTNPGNANASDNAYATASMNGETSNYLKATNFSFNIPANATITGIEARVERKSIAGFVNDESVKLVLNNATIGDEKSLGALWSNPSEEVKVFGSPTDKWGRNWTPTDVNSGLFGFAIQASSLGDIDTGSIDQITLTVHWGIIQFVPPTLQNNAGILGNSSTLNVSIQNITPLKSANWSMNGTVVTPYSADLVFMANLDNNSNIGESSTVVKDQSPINASGVKAVNASFITSGKYNGAFNFTAGPGSYLNFSTNSAYNATPSGLTVCAYLYFLTGAARDSFPTALDKGTTGVGAPFSSYNVGANGTANNFLFQFANGSVLQAAPQSSTVLNNTWYAYCGRYNGTAIDSFLDGVNQGAMNGITTPTFNNTPANTNALVIGGSRLQSGANSWGGYIDEVRIWNRSLTQAEINAYSSGVLTKNTENDWTWTQNHTGANGTYAYSFCASNITIGVCTETRNITYGLDSPDLLMVELRNSTNGTNFTGQTTAYLWGRGIDLDTATFDGQCVFFLNGTQVATSSGIGVANNTNTSVCTYTINTTGSLVGQLVFNQSGLYSTYNNSSAVNVFAPAGGGGGSNQSPSMVSCSINSTLTSTPTLYIGDTWRIFCRADDNDSATVTYTYNATKNGATVASGTSASFAVNVSSNIANLTNPKNGLYVVYVYANDSTNISQTINVTLSRSPTISGSIAGQAYTLNENVSATGVNGFNTTAANVTLDCAGYSIIGNNAAGTRGFYSSQFNTTLRNCIISGFETGAYFDGVQNSTIFNVTSTTTDLNGHAIILTNSRYANISSSRFSGLDSPVLYIHQTNNSIISNVNTTSNTSYAMFLLYAFDNRVENVNASSTFSNGLTIDASERNVVNNSFFYGPDPVGALTLYDSAYNNTVSNNLIDGKGGDVALKFLEYNPSGPTDNLIYNNTLKNATTLLSIDSLAGRNTFYWNNFTGSGIYVNDSNGSNYYNYSVSPPLTGNYSNLWGVAGENFSAWGNNLSDWSYAGYGRGEVAIPTNYTLKAASLYGIIADDNLDDISAIQAALDNNITAGQCLYLDVGIYNISSWIRLNKSSTCLTAKSKTASIIAPNVSMYDLNLSGVTNTTCNGIWQFGQCGIIQLGSPSSTSRIGAFVANVTGNGSLGTRTIQVSSNASITVNSWLMLTVPGNAALQRYLYGNSSIPIDTNNRTLRLPVQVQNISGNNITIYAPVPFALNTSLNMSLYAYTPYEGIGAGNFTIMFPNITAVGHLGEKGYNPFATGEIVNYWIKDVDVYHADNGPDINSQSAFGTIDGVTMKQRVSAKRNSDGASYHHCESQNTNAVFNLIQNFNCEGFAMHGVTNNHYAAMNVIRNSTGFALTMDFHEDAPYRNLFTNDSLGNFNGSQVSFDYDSWADFPFHSSGGTSAAHAAAGNTIWHVTANGSNAYYSTPTDKLQCPQDYSDLFDSYAIDFYQTIVVPAAYNRNNGYCLAQNISNIYPTDLYQAMLNKRLNVIVQPEGNIYGNVINTSVAITGTIASAGFSGLYIGANGSGYPYNQTTSQGKFICPAGCGDYGPLTPTVTPPPGNSVPTISSQITFVNASAGHWFLANATGSDADGASNIVSVSCATSAGTCVQLSNSSNGNLFTVSFNVSGTAPATATVNITFTDASSASVTTANANNSFPNVLPTLTAPSITPTSPNKTSTLTCTPGTMNDGDGDSENASARLPAWFRNGTVISGQTGTTLASSFFNKSDSIICQMTSTNSTWAGSASNNSSAVVIQNSAPLVAAQITFVNATVGHSFTVNATANDSDGGTDIISFSLSTTLGACPALSNSTSGINRSVLFNCSNSYPGLASIFINFTDSSGASVLTLTRNNSYPDNVSATLTAPTITPTGATKANNLTCNPGSLSDFDGDVTNTTAYAWYRNATLISGQTTATLDSSLFNRSDIIRCQQTDVAQNWTTSTAVANSSNFTIQNYIPDYPVRTYPFNASTVNTSSFNLTWSASTDLDNDALTYGICWGNNTNTTNCNTTSSLFYSLINITDNTTFYWKVNATDGLNTSAFSPLWQFTYNSSGTAFGFGASAEAQVGIAQPNANVNWTASILVNGTGSCTYTIQALAVRNATSITNVSGSPITNTGNYTNLVFSCNNAGSPYTINFQTEPNIQLDEGSVSYVGVAGVNQKRISIKSSRAQNISYAFAYSIPYYASLKFYRCPEASAAACVANTAWNYTLYNHNGATLSKNIILTSNETVFVIAWDTDVGGSGSQGDGGTLPSGSNQTNTTNVTEQQQPTVIPQAPILVSASPLDTILLASAGFWDDSNVWAGQSTYIGDVGFENWMAADFILLVLALLSAYLFTQHKKTRFAAITLISLFGMLLFTLQALGGAGI